MSVCVGSSPLSKNQTLEIAKQPSSNPIIVLAGKAGNRAICESLKSASNNWFELGMAFEMERSDLKEIENQYPNNKRRLMEMVGKRLEVTDPEHPMTWPYICKCLRSPLVERNDVAEEIEEKRIRTDV